MTERKKISFKKLIPQLINYLGVESEKAGEIKQFPEFPDFFRKEIFLIGRV